MSTMTLIDRLDAIEARAKAATPGPWKFSRNAIGTRWWMLTPDDSNRHDTEHIAGMDPTTTLAIAAEVRKLREALAAFVEFDEMHVSAKRPDVFQLLLERARKALEDEL